MSALPDRPVEPQSLEYQQTLSRIASSVAVVATAHDDSPVGCTVGSVVSVSLQPPLVLVCLDKKRFLSAAVLEHGAFSVNVLSDRQEDLATRFAGLPSDTGTTHLPPPRFEGIGWCWAGDVPVLAGTVARLNCRLWANYDGGDHRILVGHVTQAHGWPGRHPLLRLDRTWAHVAGTTGKPTEAAPRPPCGSLDQH